MFTKEEALSFVAAEKLMEKFTDAGLGAYFGSAMAKIKAVLKGQEKDWIAALENQVWAEPVSELFHKDVPNALEVLFTSIAMRRQVVLNYRALAADSPQERSIEPVGVFHENNQWYLFAFCHRRSDYRQFRTDRILAIRQTDAAFTRQHGSIDDHRQKNRLEERHLTRVVIAVQKDVLRYIDYTQKYYGFVAREDAGEEAILTFMTPSLEALARWYLMFSDCARVLSPDLFADAVSDIIEKARHNLGARLLTDTMD